MEHGPAQHGSCMRIQINLSRLPGKAMGNLFISGGSGGYNLKIPLNSGHHQWCFLGKSVEHGSTYDFRDGTGKWDWKKGIAPGDQIAWGSWPEHVVKRLN
eukprot:Stramenopile-MAST_4_protein_2260